MKRLSLFITLILSTIVVLGANVKSEDIAAKQVILRYLKQNNVCGRMDVEVKIGRVETWQMQIHETESLRSDLPAFAYQYRQGNLTIWATDGVSACRGFYDFVRRNEAGMKTWSQSRLQWPERMKDTVVVLQSQVAHHPYFNVVSFGYTSPFWDERRWDEEIDWMALHGIDMPMVLIGAEQIYREIFREYGLADKEIDAWEVGPAHLPWFRMGNLSGNSFDGPLGEEWYTRQERLCHHVLQRMRELGMTPICPAFGGFVPAAFVERYGLEADTTGWDWMPKVCRNYRIKPSSTYFVRIGKRFIQKWEERYGKCTYYLSDSFNEMEIPTEEQTLTCYGDSVYRSITAADPEAVWVTQGWTFVWQYQQWGADRFEALTRNIPDDRMMVLYMSPEYDPARYWGKGGAPCYEIYRDFSHKQWAYTLLPNMGGKNFYTGNLALYAHDFPQELSSYVKRNDNLAGYGITAEGVENNELLYELITDVGWDFQSRDAGEWICHYARCRYGSCPPVVDELMELLLQTVYSRYIDHPRFGWQNGAVLTREGNAFLDSTFYEGVRHVLQQENALLQVATPALEEDLAEIVAMYLGGKVDGYAAIINNLLDSAAKEDDSVHREVLLKQADRWVECVDLTLRQLDSVIAIHPQSLERWEKQAMTIVRSPSGRMRNARNARRIVTIWYGDHVANEPVQDYAAHIWSGLVRDYYRPRVVGAWHNRIAQARTGQADGGFDQVKFENDFVEQAPLLTTTPRLPRNRISFLVRMVKENRARATCQE